MARAILLAIISTFLDLNDATYALDAPVFVLSLIQVAYGTLLTLVVEYSVLSSVLEEKDHHNIRAKLIAVSLGWASATIATKLFDEFTFVAMEDQISYMFLIHGVSSLVTLAHSIALVYLVNKANNAHKQKQNRKLVLAVVFLVLVAGLSQI